MSTHVRKGNHVVQPDSGIEVVWLFMDFEKQL